MTNKKKPSFSKPARSKSTAKNTGHMSDKELDEVSGGLVGSDGGVSDMTSTPIVSAEILSPRDPASGLPTGKRMHKPF
jgi:hypothetical protein